MRVIKPRSMRLAENVARMGGGRKNTCRNLVLKFSEKTALRTRWFNWEHNTKIMGTDSSVGTATRYGLDGRGSNPSGGEIFRIRPHRPWGPPSLLYKGYRLSFPGVVLTTHTHLAPRLKNE